jgi:hypothetical protein
MPVRKRHAKKKKKRPKKKQALRKARKKASAAKKKPVEPGRVTRLLSAGKAMLDPQAWQHGRTLYREIQEEKKKAKKAA